MEMPDFDNFMKWVKHIGAPVPWVLLGLIILGLFFQPETVMFYISKVQSLFLWMGTGIKRRQIENFLNANIIKINKSVTKEIEDVLPYDLKIQWVKESDREAFIKDNSVIVCIDNKRNKTHTVVHAVNDYVHNGLLAKERCCIDSKVYKSSCLVMTRKLLMESYEDGISYFFENILQTEMDQDLQIKSPINKLINLDDNGMFIQIFLREMKEKSGMVLGMVDTQAFTDETNKFIDFLYEVATRAVGDYSTELNFNGVYYKIGIVLVASADTYIKYGERKYIDRLHQHVLEGRESVYLCARHKKIRIAKKVLEMIKGVENIHNHKVKFIREFQYNGKMQNGSEYEGLCIHVRCEHKKRRKATRTA